MLPAQSDPQKRDDSLYRIKSHKTDTPEYLFGEDNNSMIAILRNGKFVTDPIGTNVAIRFAKSGMNPKALQYLMGHSEISVTLNTYTHVNLEDAREEVARIQVV